VDHDAVTRSVVFNDKLLAFAKHWGFRPKADKLARVRLACPRFRGHHPKLIASAFRTPSG
jgi:hypothetical protein